MWQKRLDQRNTRVFFLGECARTAAKTIIVDSKKPEGTSSAMFDVAAAAKCCEFKHYLFWLDSMLRELSELRAGYASYRCDKRGCFSWENVRPV